MPASTKKQVEAVAWLVENNFDDNPRELVKAGMLSENSLYALWGAENVRAWCAELRATMPKPKPSKQEEIRAEIVGMVDDAMLVLHDAISKRKGDKVAVDLAKWIIAEARAIPPRAAVGGASAQALPSTTAADAEAELSAALSNVVTFRAEASKIKERRG